MWLFLVGLALLTGDVLSQGFVRFPSVPLRPITSLSGFHQRPIVASPGSFDFDDYRPGIPLRSSGGDACSDRPCGPNTKCSVNSRGIALCRCVEGYIPDGNTITGCKPQCTSNNDCPDDYRCAGQKCHRVCVAGACGINADCHSRNHRADCTCPSGYGGDPHSRCTLAFPEIRVPQDLEVDPCQSRPCGTDADCRSNGERAVCSCPFGYDGDPLTRCNRGECTAHRDCAGHRVCQALKCIDPCSDRTLCGSGANCAVRNNQPICSCPPNYMGDPLRSCRPITEHDICNPSPCGTGSNCRAKSDVATGGLRALCSCPENYIGNPLAECRPECTSDRECNTNQECRRNRCRNPCIDGCGDGAYCNAVNNRAVCSCPEYFLGNAQAHGRCYPECTKHTDCKGHQACVQYTCQDPCDGACGRSANCEVRNNVPICSCPIDKTGDPFEFCRDFTPEDLCIGNPCGTGAICKPGKDKQGNDRPVCLCPEGHIGNPTIACELGECRTHGECSDTEACYGYVCQTPCYTAVGSVCGENAVCKVKGHQPVCSCARGYRGNPLERCEVGTNARIAGRSYRKK